MRLRLLIAGLFLSTIALNSCTDPLEGVNANFSPQIGKANINIQFVNANDQSTTPIASDIQVQFVGSENYWEAALPTGKTPSWLKDVSGMEPAQPDASAPVAAVALTLNRNITPTVDKPVRFTVIAKASGFVTTPFQVEITDTGNFNFEVPMVEINSPPVGITAVKSSFSVNASGLGSTVSFEAPASNGKTEKASLVIPAGTKLFDSQGNALSGNATITFSHFDSQKETSLQAFPGGLNIHAAVDKNGQPMQPLSFFTAGLSGIEIKVGNSLVSTFSQPIQLKMEVNDSTFNPDMDRIAQAGDQVPVWSLNENNGVWRLEDTVQFIKNPASGKLEANVSVKHLSYYNLDWFADRCRSISKISFTGNLANLSSHDVVVFKMFNARNRGYFRTITLNANELMNTRSLYFYNPPRGTYFLQAYYYDDAKGQYVPNSGTSTIFNACGGSGNYNLNVPFNDKRAYVNVIIRGLCENNPRVQFYPTTPVYYRNAKTGYYWRYAGYLWRGHFYGIGVQGERYIVGVYFNGKFQQFEFTMPYQRNLYYNSTFIMPFSYCQGIR